MPMVPDEFSGTDWGPYVHISYCGVSVPPNNMGAKNTSAGLKGRRLNGGGGGGGEKSVVLPVAVLRQGSNGHCPLPQFNGLPSSQLYCPNVCLPKHYCPSTIRSIQRC